MEEITSLDKTKIILSKALSEYHREVTHTTYEINSKLNIVITKLLIDCHFI